ncbi:unnamed protein product [Parnassius mnemosyne]|uniref:DUF5641 domain-containing protein n=1 Tax=Parnassius mnemosyne TaxID=213953 RepID=A0AAV1LMF7_9NEOP
MASVLLSKLIKYVRDILTRVKITRITALTDSTIVLTIEALHPGPDGIVRCVTLRTQKSTLQRPVNKLSPLPYSN